MSFRSAQSIIEARKRPTERRVEKTSAVFRTNYAKQSCLISPLEFKMSSSRLTDTSTGTLISSASGGFHRELAPYDIEISSTLEWNKDFYMNILFDHAIDFEQKKFISIKDKNIEVHVNRFLRKVYSYSNYNDDWLNVIQGCLSLGPEYAERCKKGLIYGFIHNFSVDNEDEEVNSWKKISSYNEIFPERHLIFWKEKDPEDYKYMMEKKSVDSSELSFFKNTLRDILKNIKVKPIPDFYLKAEGGSSVIDEKEKFRGYKKIQSKDVNYSYVMEGYRSLIEVGPANLRDAFVLKEGSLNSVTLISKLARQIVSKLKWSSMKSPAEEDYVQLRAKNLTKKGYYSYLRDFTKAGLTMPHELLEATKDILVELYPNVGFEYMEVLYNHKIRYSKDSMRNIPIERGHGLGMANEITTLIQCVLDEMNRIEIGSPKHLITDVWNDDFRALGPLGTLNKYVYADLKRCEKLGLDVKQSKTAVLRGATLFLEEYYTERDDLDWSKKLLLDLSLDNAYYAYNVTHVKHLLRPDVPSILDTEGLADKLYDLYKWWGYEFYSKEFFYPDDLGGWISEYYIGHKILLTDTIFENANVSQIYKGAKAELVRPKRNFINRFSPNKLGLKNLNESFIDDYIRLLCPHADILTWNQKGIANQIWQAISQKRSEKEYWDTLYQDRQKKYQERLNFIPNFSDVFNLVVNARPERVYAIPPDFIEEYGGNLIEETYNDYRISSAFAVSREDNFITLQSKLIQSGFESLTPEEKVEIYFRSGILSEGGEGPLKTSFTDLCEDKVLSDYDFNLKLRNAFYLARDNLVPIKVSPLLELPNRRSIFKVDADFEQYCTDFEGLYPRTLDVDQVGAIIRIADRFKIDILLAFTLIRAIEINITDDEMQTIEIDEEADTFNSSIIFNNLLRVIDDDDELPHLIPAKEEDEGDSDNEPYYFIGQSSLIDNVLDSDSSENEGDEEPYSAIEVDLLDEDVNMFLFDLERDNQEHLIPNDTPSGE